MMRWHRSDRACSSRARRPAGAQTEKLPNLITVTGEGEVAIVPDLAILSAGVTTTGKTAREASEANAKMMTRGDGGAESGRHCRAGRADVMAFAASGARQHAQRAAHHRLSGLQPGHRQIARRGEDRRGRSTGWCRQAPTTSPASSSWCPRRQSRSIEAREAAIADARRKAEVYAKAANVQLGAAGEYQRRKQRRARPDPDAAGSNRRGHSGLSGRANPAYFGIGQLRAARAETRGRARHSSSTCPGRSARNFSSGRFAALRASAKRASGSSIASSVS